MRILLIEDSKRLQRSLTLGLKKAGFKMDVSGDGDEGLWYAESFDYDVIILDLMLPGMDGLTILKRLRKQGKLVHILILSAKDTVEDRVRGLDAGADDYLVKPFAFKELVARLQALIRRKYGVKSNIIKLGDIELNTNNRTVSKSNEILDIPPREYSLFEFLALQRGTIVSRTAIEEHIYDEVVEPMSNVVDAAICFLRKIIDKPNDKSIITTRRGHGYIIES
jgi:DNA-binding response OmpR family regulator